MLGTGSSAAPTDAAQLAADCRSVREQLMSIAQSLAVLRAEIDEALTSADELIESDPGRVP